MLNFAFGDNKYSAVQKAQMNVALLTIYIDTMGLLTFILLYKLTLSGYHIIFLLDAAGREIFLSTYLTENWD